MPKQWKKLVISEYTEYKDQPGNYSNFHRPVSDYQSTKENVLTAIHENNSVALASSLGRNFIYRKGERTYTNTYQGNHHFKRQEIQYFLVSPVVEALFFEHMLEFKNILTIIQTKDKLLQETFINACLRHSSIPKQVFAPLSLDQAIDLREEIERLRQHDPTHVAARILSADLLMCLNKTPSSENSLAQLEFKLNLITRLHSKKYSLAQDTNYRCIIVNISMILLGFIPNILNWIITGDFLFFKHTPQQASVERMNSHFQAFKPPRESADLERHPAFNQ